MRRELEAVRIPGEAEARERARAVVVSAFGERKPTPRRSHWPRVAAVAVALAALGAAALSSPGRAVLTELREVVGVKRAQPALFSLPAPGRLLVTSDAGVWIVEQDGSKRLLGEYREASWSPLGRFVVATKQNELAALEPDGDVRWTLPRRRPRTPRWTGSEVDTRIAYVDRTGLRVVAGDGSDDRLLAPASDVLIDWRPRSRFVLGQLWASELRLQHVDTRRVVGRLAAGSAGDQLAFAWSTEGRRALVVHPFELTVVDAVRDQPRRVGFRPADLRAAAFSPDGRHIAVLRERELLLLDARRPNVPGARLFAGAGPFEGLTWSPDGRWILIGWRTADQFVFVRSDGKRIRAVSNVSDQFRGRFLPRIEGWCCAR